MTKILGNKSALLFPPYLGDNGQDYGTSSSGITSYAMCIFMLLIVISEYFFLKNQLHSDYKSAILIINLLLFALLAIYDTLLGFETAIMLLPFDAILPSYKVAGLVAIDLYVEAILVLAATCLLKVFLGQLKYRWASLDISLFGFALVALTFLITSSDIHKSGFFYFHIVAVPTLTYFIARVVLNRDADYRSFRSHLLFSITVMAVFVVIIFIVTLQRVDVFRGLESSILFVLALFLLWGARQKRLLPFAALNFAGLVCCFPRVLLFCLLCSPVFYLIVRKGAGRVFFLIIMVSSLLGTIWLQSFVTDSDYRESNREFNRKHDYRTSTGAIEKSGERVIDMDFLRMSIYGRVNMWRSDLSNFFDQPFFGTGIGMTNTNAASSHNIHVQLLSSVGILGYFVFHLFLLQSCPQKIRVGGMLDRDLLLYFTIVLIAYINGITNGLLHGYFNYTLFPVLALIQNLKSMSSTDKNQHI